MTAFLAMLHLPSFLVLCVLCLACGSAMVAAQPPSAAPIISGVSGCPMSADNSTLLCSLPFTLTISGSNLNANYQLLNLSNTACFPYGSQSSSQLSCYVQNRYTPVSVGYGAPLPISVLDLSSLLQSNTVTALQLQPLPPVTLTSISGCEGSGPSTNNCDLRSSVVTISGSGFQYDNQPWYLLVSTQSQLYTDQPGYLMPAFYPIVGGNSIVLQLNYTLSKVWPQSAPFGRSTAGNMSVCFTHGNTLSNCLALSYYWTAPNSSQPTVQPTAGLAVNPAITVSSVTGCPAVFSNGSTANCLGFVSLTITGSNFPLLFAGLLVAIGPVRCIHPSSSGSSISCYIPDEYTAVQYGQWLPVVIIDTVHQLQSPPFSLVMFNEPAHIVLSSVTGCAGDGLTGALSTSLCQLSSDVLTLTGSGFGTPGVWQLAAQVLGSTAYRTLISLDSYIGNSSSFVVPVSSAIGSLLSLATGSNLTVNFCLIHDNQLSSSCASISAEVPNPVVTSLTGCGSAGLNISSCNPGVSYLSLYGNYFLSPVVVTVGGENCALQSSQIQYLQCQLPIIPGFIPGLYYDVVVANSIGSFVLPAAVTFTAHPTIFSISSQFCPPDFSPPRVQPVALYCPANSTLTILGAFFSAATSLSVLITIPYVSGPLNCSNPQFQSSNVLTCTLPNPGNWVSFNPTYSVTVWENSSFPSNSIDTLLFYNPATDPHIFSVQGCQAQDPATQGVAGCQTGNQITVNGVNFVASSITTQLQIFSQGDIFLCASPRVLSSTQVTCLLPYLTTSAVDSVLPIRVANMAGRTSNWLIGINYQPLASTGSSSMSDTKFIIAMAVLLPVIVLLLLAVAVLYWRGAAGGKALFTSRQSSDDEMQMSDVHGEAKA